jgi:hypothetical protein
MSAQASVVPARPQRTWAVTKKPRTRQAPSSDAIRTTAWPVRPSPRSSSPQDAHQMSSFTTNAQQGSQSASSHLRHARAAGTPA